MISYHEALTIILDAAHPLGTITTSLTRALHCVAAEDIVAAENIPPFDNAAMDGFAVRSADIGQIPVKLTIVGEIAAGESSSKILRSGEAFRITTGAKIPQGCDAVVQQEWTREEGQNGVIVLREISAGHNIRKAGADLVQGATAVRRSSMLRPQEIGVLASLGAEFMQVYRRPIVAVLTTGNELIDIEKPFAEGKIRNSNMYALSALVTEEGAELLNLGIAKDDASALEKKLAEGLKADVLITSGGVSVGKYDLVKDTMKNLGVEIRFWKVNIKPGMPLMFGIYNRTLVFGLPGNPVSSMVTFLQFVRPALRKMIGLQEDARVKIRAQLEHEIAKSDGKRHFIRAILEQRNGTLTVRSTGSQVSNVLSSLVKANCLIVMPEDVNRVAKGDEVEVELL